MSVRGRYPADYKPVLVLRHGEGQVTVECIPKGAQYLCTAYGITTYYKRAPGVRLSDGTLKLWTETDSGLRPCMGWCIWNEGRQEWQPEQGVNTNRLGRLTGS